MNKYTYHIIITLVRAFVKKPRIVGIENYNEKIPSVFVSNHLGSFGPVVMKAFFPVDLVPWVTYEIMDNNECPEYLRNDFVEKELKLKPPLSIVMSNMLSKITVSLMKYIKAIPVHKSGKKILTALYDSLHRLENGHAIVVFPEIPEAVSRDGINEFYTGFINIAKYYYNNNSTNIAFYPVCIHKKNNAISIANPIMFDHENIFSNEKARIISLLKGSIQNMLRDSNRLLFDSQEGRKGATHW
jgi:hypothetical protein